MIKLTIYFKNLTLVSLFNRASSLFEWTKYESNVRGLEVVLKVKEALDDTNKGSLSLSNAMELQNEIQKFEASDNFVVKSFEGREEFAR